MKYGFAECWAGKIPGEQRLLKIWKRTIADFIQKPICFIIMERAEKSEKTEPGEKTDCMDPDNDGRMVWRAVWDGDFSGRFVYRI